MVDILSQSKLNLSNLSHTFKKIVIISDTEWPSWLLLLDFLLESSTQLQKILVFAPSFMHSNMFGTNRNKLVEWKKFRFNSTLTPLVRKSVRVQLSSASLVLFEGCRDSLSLLLHTLLPDVCLPKLHLLCLVTGPNRLRSLKRFQQLHWKVIKHLCVGGNTTSYAWLGSPHEFRSTVASLPIYCPHVVSDILEFAPARVPSSIPVSQPLQTNSRVMTPVAHDTLINTWWCHGLLPWKSFYPSASITTTPHVVSPTPFTSTGWCSRALTARELARCFDVPVHVEKRILKAYPALLPPHHPLLASIPGKILAHAFWLGGLLDCSEGGKGTGQFSSEVFTPAFKLDSSSGQLLSQSQFNLSSVQPHDKAVKMDDALVPVHLWNSRLIRNYPSPSAIASVPRSRVDWSLSILRKWLLCRWWKNIFCSFQRFLKHKWQQEYSRYVLRKSCKHLPVGQEFIKDLKAGLDCVQYATKTTWWEWSCESRLFFWRWSPEFQQFAQDGMEKHLQTRNPNLKSGTQLSKTK